MFSFIRNWQTLSKSSAHFLVPLITPVVRAAPHACGGLRVSVIYNVAILGVSRCSVGAALMIAMRMASSDDSHDGGVDVSLVESTVGTPQVSLGNSSL